MKNLSYFLLILLLGFSSCKNQGKIGQRTKLESAPFCPEISFENLHARARSIQRYYQKATDSTLTDKAKWEKLFFCAFPASYEEVQLMMGYSTEPTPLFLNNQQWEIAQYFADLKLKSIPLEEYYAKYIDLTTTGIFDGEDPAFYYTIDKLLLKDPNQGVIALRKKTAAEIKNVFQFFYDRHGYDDLKTAYEELQVVLIKEDAKIAAIHQEVYEGLDWD